MKFRDFDKSFIFWSALCIVFYIWTDFLFLFSMITICRHLQRNFLFRLIALKTLFFLWIPQEPNSLCKNLRTLRFLRSLNAVCHVGLEVLEYHYVMLYCCRSFCFSTFHWKLFWASVYPKFFDSTKNHASPANSSVPKKNIFAFPRIEVDGRFYSSQNIASPW